MSDRDAGAGVDATEAWPDDAIELATKLGPVGSRLVVDVDGSVEHLVDATDLTDRLDAAEEERRSLVDAEPGWLVEREPTAIAERTPELTPVVLGDDVTDEDAFRASAARGGTAVLVADSPRETAAAHRLRDPEAVVSFPVALAHAEN